MQYSTLTLRSRAEHLGLKSLSSLLSPRQNQIGTHRRIFLLLRPCMYACRVRIRTSNSGRFEFSSPLQERSSVTVTQKEPLPNPEQEVFSPPHPFLLSFFLPRTVSPLWYRIPTKQEREKKENKSKKKHKTRIMQIRQGEKREREREDGGTGYY